MSDNEEINITELQAKWLAVLKACESSGQSMVAYARDNDLIVKDLYTWKKVLVSKGILPHPGARQFSKVIVEDPVTLAHECRIVFPNGISVIMAGVTDELALNKILRSAMYL